MRQKRIPCSSASAVPPALTRLAILVTLLLIAWFWAADRSASASCSPAVVMAQQTDLARLPLTFPVQSPEVAAYFQEIARPEDLASVAPEQLFLLPQDTIGQKMVAFRSWLEAQQEFEALTNPVDMVMYNPEHWELTPEDEQKELVATVQEFATFVHDRGIRFMFAPDRQYAEMYLSQVAPYIDAALLQGQRLQHDPQTFYAWVHGMAAMAHAANPDIQVFVQVGATRGTASEMFTAIQTVAGEIDGIAVWSMPRTLPILQEFVSLVREGPHVVPGTPFTTAITPSLSVATESTPLATHTPPPAESAVATSAQGIPLPTPGQGSVPTSTPEALALGASPSPMAATSTPSLQAVPVASSGGWITDLLLFVGGMGLGCLVGFGLGWTLGHRARG